ncbi:hypothetical protein D3C80_517750 [compost metagenome]
MGDEREDRKSGKRRQRTAQDEAPADLHFRETIHACRLNDFIRIAAEGLVEQEDGENREEERHHHREIGVQELRLRQPHEKRQRQRLDGHTERRDDEAQQQLAAREPELRERIGRRNRCQYLDDKDTEADNDAVQHEAPHRHLSRCPGIILGGVEFFGDRPERDVEYFCRRTDRGQRHPVEWQEHHESTERQHKMRKIFAERGHQ